MHMHLDNLHRLRRRSCFLEPSAVVPENPTAFYAVCMNLADIEERARQRLAAEQEAKIASVTALGSAAARVQAAQAELDEATMEHAQLYRKAVARGWTESDLKSLGIQEPGKRLPGRPRKPTKAKDSHQEG